MGREIRKVPKCWEHPRDERGRYIPMFDEPYKQAADKWLAACIAWADRDIAKLKELNEYIGENEADAARIFSEHPYYWEWEDRRPPVAKEWYRPEFDAPADHLQMYETVSEGTPVSPVFETKAELAQWLVGQGHSEEAAAGFVGSGWAPSMTVYKTNDKVEIHQNIDMYDATCGNGGGDAEA